MSEVVTILGSERKTTRNGKEFLNVQTSSGTMFCWNPSLWGDIQPGVATIEIEEKPGQNGGNPFRYIVGISDAHPAANPARPAHDRETNIRRQVALKAAVDLIAGVYAAMTDRDSVDLTKAVLSTAEAFDLWLAGPTDDGLPF